MKMQDHDIGQFIGIFLPALTLPWRIKRYWNWILAIRVKSHPLVAYVSVICYTILIFFWWINLGLILYEMTILRVPGP